MTNLDSIPLNAMDEIMKYDFKIVKLLNYTHAEF